jgi:cell division protein FtsN
MINRERGPRDHGASGHGAYEPAEDVRVYDMVEDEEDEEGSRLPLLIVLALVVLAMFAGVVYLAYTQGVARGRGETPVLTAASGPARVAPQQPGGAKVPYQGFKIYEQPAPPDGQVDNTTARTTGSQTAGQSAAGAADTTQSAPAPAKPASTQPAAGPKSSAAETAPAKAPAQATAAPRSLAQAQPAKPAAAPVASASGGTYFLQVGAFKSQADAEAAWKTYKARHATLLTGHDLDVQRVDLGPKGVWYRARVGGFSDRDVATALCGRLKADGGACFLVR